MSTFAKKFIHIHQPCSKRFWATFLPICCHSSPHHHPTPATSTCLFHDLSYFCLLLTAKTVKDTYSPSISLCDCKGVLTELPFYFWLGNRKLPIGHLIPNIEKASNYTEVGVGGWEGSHMLLNPRVSWSDHLSLRLEGPGLWQNTDCLGMRALIGSRQRRERISFTTREMYSWESIKAWEKHHVYKISTLHCSLFFVEMVPIVKISP